MKTQTLSSILFDSEYRYLKSYRYRALRPERVEKWYHSHETTRELCTRLEDLLKRITKRDFVFITGSGNHAFDLLSYYLISKKRKTFGLQAYTCDNLVRIIQKNGGHAQLGDVDEKTINLKGPDFFPQKNDVTIGIHTHGKWLDTKLFDDYAANTNSIFVEDCAHALGGGSLRNRIGKSGWASIFSFRKNTFAGSGGAVGTNDSTFAEFLKEKLNKIPFEDENRDIWGKIALLWKKCAPANTFAYPAYSRFEYSAMRVKKTLPSRLDLSVMLSQVEEVDSFNEQARENARKLHRILLRENFLEKSFSTFDEAHNYCRMMIRFPTAEKASEFNDLSIRSGFETGMNYSRDFEENVALVGKKSSDFPACYTIAQRGVPVGLFNLNSIHVERLGRLILEGRP